MSFRVSDASASSRLGIIQNIGETLIRATQDGRLVGAVFVFRSETYGFFWALDVHPGVRRAGIGTRLLDEVVAYVGSDRPILANVVDPSPGLFDFYAKSGFRRHIDMPVSLIAGQDVPGYLIMRDASTASPPPPA